MKIYSYILVFGYALIMLVGCTLYISVEGKKAASHIVEATEKPVVTKPKTRYQELKDAHNAEWDNLPKDTTGTVDMRQWEIDREGTFKPKQ